MTVLTIFLLLALPIALAGLARLRQICRMRRAADELEAARTAQEWADLRADLARIQKEGDDYLDEVVRVRLIKAALNARPVPPRRYALGRRRRLAD